MIPSSKYCIIAMNYEDDHHWTVPMKKRLDLQTYESPCGTMLIGSFEGRLCLCDWLDGRHRERTVRRVTKLLGAEVAEASCSLGVMAETVKQLDAYFNRQRREFDLPLLFAGTVFQKKVWEGLLSIPYGQTISYGELARRIGMPHSVRAVANACGANPISIIAPCHRVLGSDGKLTGYGGGLSVKRFLLSLEFVVLGDL